MPTRSNLLTQSSLSPDLNSRFASDWQAAQERFNAGINAGYSQPDADALYLQPVRSKWKIIASSPQLVQDKNELNKFHNEFDTAMQRFHNNINQSGQDIGDAANYGGSINPTLDKWSIAGSLPVLAAQNDPQQTADEMGALKEVQDGYDPMQVLQGHHSDRWNPTFQNRFFAEAMRAGTAKKTDKEKAQALADKSTSKNSPESLGVKRAKIGALIAQAENGDSPAASSGIADFYRNELGKLDSQITNGVPQAWQFTPPSEPSPQTVVAPDAKTKVSLANEISKAHPDWTKEQVILAVNGKLKGATP